MEPMDAPDAWPPNEDEQALNRVTPMFPLPGVFLFPRQVMPLHVFEPRYRQMIDDSLDGPGRLVIGTVLEQDRTELGGEPPVVPIAGIGEIARHEKTDDGRYYIWLAGLTRARIEEVESDRLYRHVRVEALEDLPVTEEDEAELRPPLQEAIRERTEDQFELSDELDLGTLADVLTQCIPAPEAVVVDLHQEIDPSERARKALAAHARFPQPRR